MIPSRTVYVPRYVPALSGVNNPPLVPVSLPCEPWLRPAPVAPAPVAQTAPVAPVARPVCAFPGCDVTLYANNKWGLCRPHRHAKGLCGCAKCRKGAA